MIIMRADKLIKTEIGDNIMNIELKKVKLSEIMDYPGMELWIDDIDVYIIVKLIKDREDPNEFFDDMEYSISLYSDNHRNYEIFNEYNYRIKGKFDFIRKEVEKIIKKGQMEIPSVWGVIDSSPFKINLNNKIGEILLSVL